MNDPAPDQLVFPFGMGDSSPDPIRVDLLGGKGASLAEMSRQAFPVPPGFTISTACCQWVDRHLGKWPDRLEGEIRQAMARLEQTTRRTFGAGLRPLLVAVRSGAAVSMPGMMDTILNCGLNPSVADSFRSPDHFWSEYADHIRLFAASVAGLSLSGIDGESAEHRAIRYLQAYEQRTGSPFPTDPWDVLRQSISAVFSSWHSERAVAYRKHHDVSGALGTAVNVQAMFPSERSGVLFTIDPNNPGSGAMVLEASWGLGEAVVSGAVTPDIYLIDRDTLTTRRETAGTRPAATPALTLTQQAEIARLGLKIEAHFGSPADIEWGIADGQVALLQTRKIRGLDLQQDLEQARFEEIQKLKTLAGRVPAVWVVHNLSETLLKPTPLTWELIRWFMSAEGGYGQMYRLLGRAPRERQAGSGFLELIAGRIYVDPVRAAEFHFGRMPFEYDVDEIIRDRSALDRPPSRFNFERTDSLFFFRLPGLVWQMVRGARRTALASIAPHRRFHDAALPKLETFLAEARALDLSRLSTSDLIAELVRRRNFVLGEFAAESLIPGFFGGMAHDQLRRVLSQLFGQVEGELFAEQLSTGLAEDITVEQNLFLSALSRQRSWISEDAQSRPALQQNDGPLQIEGFLDRYGHRAVHEMELAQPRWREDREYVGKMIDRMRDPIGLSPEERHARQVQTRLQAEEELPSRLASVGGSSFLERITQAMRQAQLLLPYRELGKFHLMRGYETIRTVLLELATRWSLGRDLFFLELTELSNFESDRIELLKRLERRKQRWKAWQKMILPDLIDSRSLEDLGKLPKSASEKHQQLTCRSIASGTTRGIARIVMEPADVGDLGHDYILVCPSTDPGWTPLFVNARGLIVERGGVLSHGAIVARDFGIPAVVLEGATQLIAEGNSLEVDADSGIVRILTSPTGTAAAVEAPVK